MECKASTLALLLDAGVSGDLGTLLRVAAQRQSTECVQLLLARGVDVDATENHLKYTALHDAAERNYIEMMQVLLAAGADPRVRNSSGQTPLDVVRGKRYGDYAACISILEAALPAPDLGRLFLRARAIVDMRREAGSVPAPACLKGRLDAGQELPAVVWMEGGDVGFRRLVERLVGVDGEDEQQAAAIPHDLLACVVSFSMPK